MVNSNRLSTSVHFGCGRRLRYVYRRGIQGTDFSYAATVGLFNSVIALLLVIVANTISRKVSEESVW